MMTRYFDLSTFGFDSTSINRLKKFAALIRKEDAMLLENLKTLDKLPDDVILDLALRRGM